jgi:hypothetical protein
VPRELPITGRVGSPELPVGADLRVGWQGESPPTVTRGNSDTCKCPQPNLGAANIQKGMNVVSSMRLGGVWNIQKFGLLGEIDHSYIYYSTSWKPSKPASTRWRGSPCASSNRPPAPPNC